MYMLLFVVIVFGKYFFHSITTTNMVCLFIHTACVIQIFQEYKNVKFQHISNEEEMFVQT